MSKLWIRLAVAAIVVAACGIGIWRWYTTGLEQLSSMPVGNAETVTLGAMGDLVLDKSVLEERQSDQSKAILDQYRENPSAFDEKARFVRTWMRASSLIKGMSSSPITPGRVISSSTLSQASTDDRVDAWGNSFCLYSNGARTVALSSGGGGQLSCDSLGAVAKRLTTTVSSKKLFKDETGLYAVVQPLMGHS